jgi:hypothetical protein
VEGGRQALENNTVAVLPKVPETEQPQHVRRAGVDGRRQGASCHLRDAAQSSRRRAQGLPEALSKRTLKENVQGSFKGSRAESALTLSRLDDLLPQEIAPALDAFTNQEPCEKPHPGGDCAAPNELEVEGPLPTVGVQLVERGVFDLTISPVAKQKGADVCFSSQANGSEHGEQEISLASGHRCEAWDENGVQPSQEHLAHGGARSEEWVKSSGALTSRGTSPIHRSEQKEVRAPSPMVTLERHRYTDRRRTRASQWQPEREEAWEAKSMGRPSRQL